MENERESIEFDVLFVGGGPANLAGAIRLMQLAQASGLELEVALIEKGAEIGAHCVSGAIVNPVALQELMPDYTEQGCPVENVVRGDEFYFLTARSAYRFPLVPRYMHNQGHLIVSLARFARWMGGVAEEMGVNIFPGFTGKQVLYAEDQKTIIGVRTGDQGLDEHGKPKANFEPGIDLLAKVTVFGEGARGSLYKEVEAKLDIAAGKMPQVYETGIKEVIQVPSPHYFDNSKGNDIHTLGYPLGLRVPGGGFIYEMQDNQIAIGYLTALCYDDPMLDPFEVFIEFKRHPFVAELIKGGKVIEQGARTVSTGGFHAMPELAVDGAVFTGGSAGIHNTPALKGIHVGMKSGMQAAEAIFDALQAKRFDREALQGYTDRLDNSWVRKEVYEGRNFAAALAKTGFIKWVHLGAQYLSKGRGLIDKLPLEADWKTLKARKSAPTAGLDKSVYDGELMVDKLTGVYLSKTMHREDQPSHLIVHDTDQCINECYPRFQSPCTRFCPGSVYEIETDTESGRRKLKLNPSNCFHCKTCDIKDPFCNITWVCPEGGEGPGYQIV